MLVLPNIGWDVSTSKSFVSFSSLKALYESTHPWQGRTRKRDWIYSIIEAKKHKQLAIWLNNQSLNYTSGIDRRLSWGEQHTHTHNKMWVTELTLQLTFLNWSFPPVGLAEYAVRCHLEGLKMNFLFLSPWGEVQWSATLWESFQGVYKHSQAAHLRAFCMKRFERSHISLHSSPPDCAYSSQVALPIIFLASPDASPSSACSDRRGAPEPVWVTCSNTI